MSRTSQLAKNTLILSIGTFLPKLVGFVTLPIMTGYLTKVEYGTFDLITIMVLLLLPSITLQIKSAAFRYLIDVRDKREEQVRIVTNIVVFTIVVSILILAILFFIPWGLNPIDKLWICLYYLLDIAVNTVRQVARGLSFNLKYSMSAIVSAIGQLVFAVLLVWYFRLGLTGAVITLCGAALFSLIYLSVSIKVWNYIAISKLDKVVLKELIGYSWPLVPNELSQWVMRVSDRIIITIFLGVSANAVYAVANKIPSIITLAQSTLTLAWQENASIASKDEDVDEYYSYMFHVILRLQAGFLCFIIGVTPILFKLLIRGDYIEAYNQMPILCMAIFYASMATYLGGIYVAHKESKSVGVTTTVAAIINVVLDIGAIHFFGLYAASGSTLISYIFLFLFRAKDIKKISKLTYDNKLIVVTHIMMLIVCCIYYFDGFVITAINLLLGLLFAFILNIELFQTAIKSLLSLIKDKTKTN